MSSPKKSIRSSVENDELVQLYDRLRSLNVTNLTDLCKELRMISVEYDAKAAAVNGRLAELEENLPAMIEKFKKKKQELKRMKTDILALRADYKLHVKKVQEVASKNCPDAMERLASINEKMVRVEQLKCKDRSEELIANCLLAISVNESDGVLHTLKEAIDNRNDIQQIDIQSQEEYSNRLSEVANNIESWTIKRLEKIIDSIRWPWSDAQDERAYKDEIDELRKVVSALYLSLTIKEEYDDDPRPSSIRLTSHIFQFVSYRFNYHFYGNRKTADPTKPQWFLSQLIMWMRHSLPLYDMIIQPVFDTYKVSIVSAHNEFVRQCCELGMEKSRSLLNSIEYGDDLVLFSSLIDELISFEEQRCDWELCPGEYNVLSLICEEDMRSRWLMVENMACSARVDDILSSESRWNHRFIQTFSDVDPLLVCEGADSFVSLLHCLQMRTRGLPCGVTRRLFVDLQVMLVDDFRSRLVQVANQAESPWETPFHQIMNAMWYMEKSIEEWGEDELISSLDGEDERIHARAKLSESIKLYKHVWEQMAGDVVRSFKSQLKSFAQNYASMDWRGHNRIRNGEREISLSFCPILLRVRTALTSTIEKMCTPSITILFRKMLDVVAEVLMEHVLKFVHLNGEGAEQMSFDVGVGLVSVVNSILERTNTTIRVEHEKSMVKVLSCLRLLSLSVPNAMLLREELISSGDEEAEDKLMTMKIHLIDKEYALSLLKRRSDIRIEGSDIRI